MSNSDSNDEYLACVAALFIENKSKKLDDLIMTSPHSPHSVSYEVNGKLEDETMKKMLFYEYTDAKFKFTDDQTINFDKKLLCWRSKSPVFYQICFGPFSKDTVEITDFNYETFQLFLNCVMGFNELTRESAIKIFPLACKYLMTKFIEKCAIVLKPVQMNEDVCDLLNLAFIYHQPKLLSVVKEYILDEGSPYGLLENVKLSYLLSKESFLEVVKWVTMDSCVLNAIVRWCNHFLESNNKSGSINELLYELKLNEHFKVDIFESGILLHEFIESNLGKFIFCPSHISSYFINPQYSAQKKCKWIRKRKGQSLTEEYDPSDLQLNNYYDISFDINKIVTYLFPNLDLYSCNIIKYNSNQPGNRSEKIGNLLMKNQTVQFSFQDWYNDIRYTGSSYVKFEVKYNFNQDCRILVTNIKPKMNNNETTPLYTDKFYFTKKIIPTRT